MATWAEGDLWDPGNPENRERTRQLKRELRDHFARWDPIWGGDMPDAATDEYDAYISPVLHLLHEGQSAEAIEAYLVDIVVNRMDLDTDRSAERRLAQDLVNWWTATTGS